MITSFSLLKLALLSTFLTTFPLRVVSFASTSIPSSAKSNASLHATTVSPSNTNTNAANSKLFVEYKTTRGEILNPYEVLKVSHDANMKSIKQAYYKLCKTYHPDGIYYLFRDILPGRCKNIEDVEYEWERIKTSKEILTNNKRRVRYDRLIAMLNPQQAMARTVSKIISNVVFGMFIPHCIKFGSFASKSIASNVLKTTQNIKENNNHMLQQHKPQHNNPFGLDLSMMQQQQQDNIDTLVETMSTVQQTAVSHFKEFTLNFENEWKKHIVHNSDKNMFNFNQIPFL